MSTLTYKLDFLPPKIEFVFLIPSFFKLQITNKKKIKHSILKNIKYWFRGPYTFPRIVAQYAPTPELRARAGQLGANFLDEYFLDWYFRVI